MITLTKRTTMTPAAVNSFDTTERSVKHREPRIRRSDHSATPQHIPQPTPQQTHLQQAGNLTDWKTSYADIQLKPSSCVDSYNDLVVRGNPIPLLPSDVTPDSKSLSASFVTLPTLHTTEQLYTRCRYLQQDTAQTPVKARQNLYLAAGFMMYQSNGETKRAPILLIPVSIGQLRGKAEHHAISYVQGKPLRVNPHIIDMCSTHVEQRVKPFKDTNDLREYLRSIQSKVHQDFRCKVSANSGIVCLQKGVLTELSKEEQINVELERTKPGAAFTPLPAIPNAFDPQLAIKILRFVEPAALPEILQSFTGQPDNNYPDLQDLDPTLDESTLEKYHDCAGWLIDVGLGHWKLKNIAALPKRMLAMESHLHQLLASAEYSTNFRDEHQTVGMLQKLNKVKEKIVNAPPEMQHHSISLHADTQTRLLLQQAKIQASSLEHEMKQVKETYTYNAIPSSRALNRLIEIISQRDDESQLDNPEYFRARRTLNEILGYHNGSLTDNDLQQLHKLAKTLTFSDTFNNDPYYTRHFGSLFKGTDTNWQRLDSVVNFNHTLSQALGSSLLVAQFSDKWVSFERDFRNIENNIEAAANSTYKLCSLIPTLINESTKIEHAVRTAEKFRCRIDQWQKFLHKNYADQELTPFQLLSHLDLGDYNFPTVTLSPHQIDERIYRHIAGPGLSGESVTATAQWLQNVMVDLQTDTATVRRFVDREAALHSSLQ